MSVSHHGAFPPAENDPQQSELMKRFMDQVEGKAKRIYEKGRIAADDDGALAIAVTADTERKRVIIDFGKKVDWIGLDANDCLALAKMLIDKAKLVADGPLVMTF
jgi:hypothetical protein